MVHRGRLCSHLAGQEDRPTRSVCSVLRILEPLPAAHAALLCHLLRLRHSVQPQGSPTSSTAPKVAMRGALGVLCWPEARGSHGQEGLTTKVRGPLPRMPWGQSPHCSPSWWCSPARARVLKGTLQSPVSAAAEAWSLGLGLREGGWFRGKGTALESLLRSHPKHDAADDPTTWR